MGAAAREGPLYDIAERRGAKPAGRVPSPAAATRTRTAASRRRLVEAERVIPSFIGAEKHITFGGHQSSGVNIPGGLRMPVPTRTRTAPARARTRAAAPHSAPSFIGAEKHITFGGHQSSGVNIPGGLRMPVPHPRVERNAR